MSPKRQRRDGGKQNDETETSPRTSTARYWLLPELLLPPSPESLPAAALAVPPPTTSAGRSRYPARRSSLPETPRIGPAGRGMGRRDD